MQTVITDANVQHNCLSDGFFCGVAGWSYPDWEGFVYPPNVRDKLRYTSFYVDAIEINCSFYRIPDVRTVASWEKRTSDFKHFIFTAKLPQDITHGGRLTKEVLDSFKSSFEPLMQSGRLAHILAQFRYDFADSPEARKYLKQICDAFSGTTNLVFELRHNSWQASNAIEELKLMNVTLAALDYPLGITSFSMDITGVGTHAYFRLHGRNAKAWFRRDAGRDDAYNYLYNEEEISQIVSRARRIRAASSSLTLIANNHYQGKEMVNAIQIMAAWEGQRRRIPPLLANHYPQLLSCGVVESPPS